MSEAADILYPSMAEAAPEPARAAPDTAPEDILYPDQGKEEERPDAYESDQEAPVGSLDDLALPEGFDVDEVTSNDFMDLAGRIDINPSQAQELVNFQAEITNRQAEAWKQSIADGERQIKADPEIGGSNYDRTYADAKGLVKDYGEPGLGDLFDHYGLSHHPDFMRFMSRMSRAVRS